MMKFIYALLVLVLAAVFYILLTPSSQTIITESKIQPAVEQTIEPLSTPKPEQTSVNSFDLIPVDKDNLIQNDMFTIIESNPSLANFFENNNDWGIPFFENPFFLELLNKGRSADNEYKFFKEIDQHYAKSNIEINSRIICSEDQCISRSILDGNIFEMPNFGKSYCQTISSLAFDCGIDFTGFSMDSKPQSIITGRFNTPKTLDNPIPFLHPLTDFYRLNENDNISIIQQQLSSLPNHNSLEYFESKDFLKQPKPVQQSQLHYRDIILNSTPKITAAFCELGLCFYNIDQFTANTLDHEGNVKSFSIIRDQLPYCEPIYPMLTLHSTTDSETLNLEQGETTYKEGVIACSIFGTKDQLQKTMADAEDQPIDTSLFKRDQKLITAKETYFKERAEVNRRIHFGAEDPTQYQPNNIIFTPYEFDKQLSFNNNQESLSQLVQTRFVENYLKMMINGYSEENTLTLGQSINADITFNDQSSEVICDNSRCLLYFAKIDNNNSPCSRLTDERYTCRHLSTKKHHFILAEFEQLNTTLTKVNKTSQQTLIDQGLAETIMEDYLETKMANTLVSKKRPLSVNNLRCIKSPTGANQCEFSIENGAFAKTRGDNIQAKVKFDLTPQCQLTPLEPSSDGPLSAHWQCLML